MTRILYELAGAEVDRNFSPFSWRARMALKHKGLAFERVPVRFTEKEKIAFSGQKLVPVLVDGDRTITDSWDIACYLEDTYPDRPLFGSAAARGMARFVGNWANQVLHPAVLRLIVLDVFEHLDESSRGYFRSTREQRFGISLERFAGEQTRNAASLKQALAPLRATLEQQPFVAGDRPAFADYAVFGAFQWARCVSARKLLEPNDPVHAWRARMLDLFDGEGAKAKGYAC